MTCWFYAPTDKQGIDGCPDGIHLALKFVPRDFAASVTPPDVKHQFDLPHQIMAEALHLRVLMVDQSLKVSLQMRPTPLQVFGPPIHLRAVAIDDARENVSQQLRQGGGFAAGKDGEHGNFRGHRRPQPGFLVSLLGRRFVHIQLFLVGQRPLELFVGLCEGRGNLILHFNRQRRTTGHAEKIL